MILNTRIGFAPFFREQQAQEAAEMAEQFSWGEFLPLAGASVAISVTGLTVAVLAYALHRIDLGEVVAARFPTINAFFANKWYLDAINEKLFVRSSRKLAREVLEVDAKWWSRCAISSLPLSPL